MKPDRYIVMGAGELGFHLARSLDRRGADVVLIDNDPFRRTRIEEQLDVRFLMGSGTQVPILELAEVDRCELFIAASNSEESNLVAAALARDLGAKRSAVRLETTEDLTTYRAQYERLFAADLLLSPNVLATTQILNFVLGHNTHGIDYLAHGKIQLRTIEIQPGSVVAEHALNEVKMPVGSRVVALIDADEDVINPSGTTRAKPGQQALVLTTASAIPRVEELFSLRIEHPRVVVIAGAGATATSIAKELRGQVPSIKLIEIDRQRAEAVAATMGGVDVIHGDATDVSVLRNERIDQADVFITATGHDDTNLMAALIGEEMGVQNVITLVRRSETSKLWEQAGTLTAVSPRYLAAARINEYIENGFQADMTSLHGGALQVLQRTVYDASPVVGASLAEINPPPGLLVGAVVRGDGVLHPQVFGSPARTRPGRAVRQSDGAAHRAALLPGAGRRVGRRCYGVGTSWSAARMSSALSRATTFSTLPSCRTQREIAERNLRFCFGSDFGDTITKNRRTGLPSAAS